MNGILRRDLESVDGPWNNSKFGCCWKNSCSRHIFKGLPMLQTFVSYGTKVCHVAKMNLPRESSHISKTDVFTRQRLWQAWNKICNS